MNLVLFLLNLLLASYAPTSQATDDSTNTGSVNEPGPGKGKGKGGKYGDGDFIIWNDIMP